MSVPVEPLLLALDVGAKRHAFAWELKNHREVGEIANDLTTLRPFLKGLIAHAGSVRLLVEATGIYYLDLALLADQLGIEVSVINPKAGHNFAKALSQRNKTDRLDAEMLLEFLKRMPFQAWQAPSLARLELRHYGRHLVQLTEESTAIRNRLHALSSTHASPAYLKADLKRAITSLQTRIERIRTRALTLIRADAWIQERFEAVITVIGVADVSAVSLLSELLVLPPSLSARACASHAGLDPLIFESGTSVHKPARISRHGNKYLRRALFYPAMAAGLHDPRAAEFKARLLSKGKKKMQANVAIMRKMLTAIWAIIKNPQPYDGKKLYSCEQIA
ncbi:MAG: IS110 family transposase [Xanthomonadales bacterium]|nr:IS110 family transposase [Xanthomonadales bacterium]